MTSLLVLAACALLPWVSCAILRAWFPVRWAAQGAARERALLHYRRACLLAGSVALPAAAVVGALVTDPSLSARFPRTGAWFFASVSMTTAWVAVALAQRTPEETAAMKRPGARCRCRQCPSSPPVSP